MAPKAVTKRPRAMAITADMQAFKAFQTIRQVIIEILVCPILSFFTWTSFQSTSQARAFKRLHGFRAKKAADAEADELSKKKYFVARCLESAEIHLANISLTM